MSRTLNKEQQQKLAKVLLDESVICAERGDNDDAKALMMRSVEITFQDKIRRMIDGDIKLIHETMEKQHSSNLGMKGLARIIMHILANNKEFKDKYKFEVVWEE
tara:strand:+ start:2364 stop:2675 length:312 start_codon:yes stop_codon:yes gene_type:complete